MLKAEQIPDEVARLADEAYYDIAGDNPTMSDDDIMKHAIAAAINAWPDMGVRPTFTPSRIILPLNTEPRDDQGE